MIEVIVTFFKRIVSAGLVRATDPMIKQRVVLSNSLTLATLAFTFGLMGLVIGFGLFDQLFVGFSLIIALCLVFWFNSKGWHLLASLFLVNLTCAGIMAASFLAFDSEVYADTENWLIGFIAVSVFFFDGRVLFVQFLIIFSELILAKYCKYVSMDLSLDRDFAILVSNSVVMCTGIYLSLVIVKNALQKTLENLKRTNDAKKKLLSIIAHDIKSPLSTFEALLSVGKSGIMNQEDFFKHQEELRERFAPLQETIDGVLDWSKIGADSMTANPESFDPVPEIEKIMVVYRGISESKGIRIDFVGQGVDIFMDKNHFKLIMRNLIHNALKFTLEGGAITIKMHKKHFDKLCLLTVKDTGVGMMQESIQSILKKQIVLSESGTKGEVGTGLGLNVSVELLELNHCELAITSKVGDGSTFHIKIPVPPKTTN